MLMILSLIIHLSVSIFAIDTGPTVGEACPVGSVYDGANCFFGKAPTGLTAFIYDNGFYHSGTPAQCSPGTYHDGANCFKGKIPNNYEAFLYQNGWYVKHNKMYVKKPTGCPSGGTFDSANCFMGDPPSGRVAKISLGHFGFKRNFYQNCSNIFPSAYGLVDPFTCGIKKIPDGFEGFLHGNHYYVKPSMSSYTWGSKWDFNINDSKATNVCLNHPSLGNLNLMWSEDFNNIADGTRCYTSSAEHLQCVYKAWWGHERCADAPINWSNAGYRSWTIDQRNKYAGLKNLNKCIWQVYDQFNQWDSFNQPANRKGAFSPANVKIENGILKMITSTNPQATYDCGRDLGDHLASKKCPYVGAHIGTNTGLPWTANHLPTHSDPAQRYVGKAYGYGRFEFRAKISSIGHGAWPALWMFVDQRQDQTQPGVELDALEAIGSLDGITVLNEKTSFIRGLQTVHDWGTTSTPHVSEGVAVPISIGKWHTYAVEWTASEIRVYIDGCLRNRVTDGQVVKDMWSDNSGIFHVPKSQTVNFLIGNAPAGAEWLPLWYRAASPNGVEPRADFKPTTLEVDYVRYYSFGMPSTGTPQSRD